MGTNHVPRVAPPDLWVMLLSTVRYSMGRMTYMSNLAGELVIGYAKYLTKMQLEQIVNEIEGELLRCARTNVTLGMDMDDRAWRKNVAIIKDIIEKGEGKSCRKK